MHTVLGAGGVTSNELVKELRKNNESYQLVSRNPMPAKGERWVASDITDPQSLKQVVRGSEVVYLLAGTKYDIRTWREFWPRVMNNTIEACKATQAKLLFFDNVYPYGLVRGIMTEETPYNPVSRKGEVRAKIATHLMAEAGKGNLKAIIARAADFYGPKYEKSFANVMVFDRLARGKSAQWMVNDKVTHSFTYVGDLGKSLYALVKKESAINQVWHMPTASPPLTGKEFIEKVAVAFGVKPKYTVLSKFMISMAGLFNRNIKEAYEMLYQNEYDYIFDSSKIEKSFSLSATPYETGISESVPSYQ